MLFLHQSAAGRISSPPIYGCCAIISPTVLIRGETTYTRQEITQGDEVRAENISFVVLTAEAVLATTGLHTHSRVQIHDDDEAEGVSWSSREAGISRTHMNTFNLQRSRCWSQPDPVGFTAHGHGRVQPWLCAHSDRRRRRRRPCGGAWRGTS